MRATKMATRAALKMENQLLRLILVAYMKMREALQNYTIQIFGWYKETEKASGSLSGRRSRSGLKARAAPNDLLVYSETRGSERPRPSEKELLV